MVQLLLMPILWAVRWTSIHSSASSLPSQMISRTSGWKISAPPPGSDPRPASRSRRSTSSIEIFSSLANQPISMAVKAADDVELGGAVAALVPGVGVHLVVAHLPGVAFALQGREAAELAVVGVDADVRRVDVAVDVEEGDVAVDPPADGVGQLAEVEEVGRRQARQGVGGIQADAVLHLGGDVAQRRGKKLGMDVGLGSHEISISRAVVAKSQTERIPLAVKKAAFRRERSPGRTTQCW